MPVRPDGSEDFRVELECAHFLQPVLGPLILIVSKQYCFGTILLSVIFC